MVFTYQLNLFLFYITIIQLLYYECNDSIMVKQRDRDVKVGMYGIQRYYLKRLVILSSLSGWILNFS